VVSGLRRICQQNVNSDKFMVTGIIIQRITQCMTLTLTDDNQPK